MSTKKWIMAAMVTFALIGVSGNVYALKYPHTTPYVNLCSDCHKKTAPGFISVTGFKSLCFNSTIGCHWSGASASKKALDLKNPSNRFKSIRESGYAAYSTDKRQSSHGWKIPNINNDAGVTQTNKWGELGSGSAGTALSKKITCTRCHRAHGEKLGYNIYAKFLRQDPKGDNICFQCHAARQWSNMNVRDPLPAGKHYSHPVNVSLGAAKAAKPSFFEGTTTVRSGTLPPGYSETARMKLYTTYDNSKSDAVVCSTCHGPLHAADSNPYTFDSLSSYSRLGNYSNSAGNLLRRYPMSRSNNMCTSCHKVSAHKSYNMCSDCHEPHKKAGDTNIYLIKKIIATPYGNHSVFFTSTTQMAKRYGVYSLMGGTRTKRSTAVCQVCHRNISHHRAYSTTGADRTHNMRDSGDWTKGYKNCVGCHKHTNANSTGAFKPEGCNGCHGDPPSIGKHAKHVGDSNGYNSFKWNEGKMYDQRGASSYGFSCGRCHSPWIPYTAGVNSSSKFEGKNHYGEGNPSTTKVYTTEIGFKDSSPLPQNPSGSYTYGGAGAVDRPYNVNFRTPSTGTCANLYCHGQFYGGYTSNNPNFNDAATQSCVGSCHGTNAAKLPGVNGTGEWGAHRRHIGNANSQQYGSGTPNFRCNACHYATAVQNRETTISSRVYHVNGRTNVRFAPAYGYSASTYKGLNDYTSSPSMVLTTKTQYGQCSKIYCHSDGSRTDAATQGGYSSAASYSTRAMAFPGWSSLKNFTTNTGGIKRCTKCHGNDKWRGITSAMPEYATRPGKGNAHETHIIKNRILCYACHSNTVGSDNRTINTAYHVNKTYDVNMESAYGGTWDNTAKRCSNVKCHGQKLTPAWNDPARCQDCHFTSTGVAASNYTSEKKGYIDNYRFRNFTIQNSMPRIYSSEWKSKGHGSTLANKVCDDCHASTFRHLTANVANNPYRLDNSDTVALCQQGGCHPTYKSHTKADMDNYGNAVWAFNPKCVDCHDPHSDSNRKMVKRYINFTTGSDAYGRVANPYANNVKLVSFTTVGSNTLLTWSSFVKADYSGICQRCHNTQAEMKYFRKYSTATGEGYTPSHNAGSKCTECHLHTAGFKPKACNGCHFFPPKEAGSGDPNGVGARMKHNRHVNWTSPYVDKSYDNLVNIPSAASYNFACKKCHAGTHASDATNPRQVEVGFDATAYPKNPNGVYARFNGWTETGAEADNYDFMYSSGKCSKVYCHGKFFGGYTENAARFDNTSAISGANWSRKQICGACHGASQAKPPTGGAHTKHAGTYSLGCRNCHRDTNGLSNYTVTNKIYHADGKTRWRLYTTEDRIGGDAKYSGSVFGQITTKTSSPTYSLCSDIYCHSNGTSSSRPFPAYGNYTVKWGLTASAITGAGKGCSLCHGNKGGSSYAGITSAMPNYNSGSPKINSHRKHVVDNGFSCYACHTNTVDSTGRAISSAGVSTYHVNMAYDVSFPAAYSGVYNGDKTCSRVKCHGRRITPAWGGTVGCTNCHFQGQGAGDGDVMDFSFRNYSNQNSVPKIYSTEWMASGHGKASGNYNRTNNPAAAKICANCHVGSVKHNSGTNFFRLTGLGLGTDPSSLCKRCHGTVNERQVAWMGNRTGIQGHTQQILSSEGYQNLTTWRFKPKCTDCHDPHGDSNSATSGNIAMIRNTVLYNLSGSDSSGRPIRFGSLSTVFFEKYTGTRSFDDNTSKGRVCAVCHKRTAHNGNGASHANEKLDCRSCHKHKQGFTPAGCTGCHGDDTKQFGRASWAPPKGPTTPLWSDSMTNRSSLHLPHSYNPKGRPGFGNQTGFACEYCHDDSVPAASGHNTAKVRANMNNLTSTTGWSGRNKQSKIGFGVEKAPADNTCWNTSCHTPRAYIRTWQKPKDCDDCHGYTKGKGTSGLTGRQFNLQTTQSHKIHINWTGIATPPASWKKNYRFACSNCHYDPANNYSTHYSGLVNITSNGPVNTVGGQFYTRGRSFEGFTTGNESLGTCSKTYCHGNFANGTAITKPNWKKGVTTVNCGSCHRAKTAKVSGWGTGTLMPAPHPTHVNSATYNFSCARCHNWTVTNNTTVQFTYSTHVNTRKDVNFDNTSGAFTNSSKRMCQNNYCHSSGATVVPRTVSNYTADWLDGAAVNKTGAGKGCSYCHGSKGNGFGGITAAMPNYANQAHAKHARNTTGDSFRCNVCHAATVDAAGTILNNGKHVNKFKNISIIAPYKSGQTAYSTTVGVKKTCKNITCHGGLTTPLWTLSTGINCMDCHKSASGDTDKRISSNNTFQGYSESVPKIYTGQWLQRGHGRPTARGNYLVSSNSAANKTCTDCHGAGETRANGLSTKHGNSAANPFRLLTAPNRPNVLCESCHGTNATNPGKGTMVGIQTHASSVTGGGGNGFSFWIKCIDCHDPHGDNNVQMLHSTIARPSKDLTKKESSNQFGALFFNATGRNVDFVNNVYTSDYAKKVTSPKVCQVCHSQTFKPNSSAQRTRFRWNGSSETEHGTGKCTSCHGHNQGFKGVKCDACHGNPPTSKFNMLTSTTNGEKWPFSGATSAGAHNRHVTLFGSDSNTCAFCHQQGMYNSGASNDNIDIGFKAFGIYTGKYTGKSGVRNGWYGYSGVGITTGNTARCDVQCHGQKGWLTASYGTPTAPLWENNKRTATCGKCHGAKKAATSGSWPATAAHALHAGTGGTQLKYMCKLCHDNTVQGTATSLSSSYHVNSVANVAFGTAADPRADTSSSYLDSNTQVNSAVNGKCTNTYCHSKGTDSDKVAPYTNAADFANWTATWNDVRGGYRQATANTKAKCNYCHGNKNYTGILAATPRYSDGSPKSNKHPKHVETYRFLCTSCHVNVTVNNTSIDASGGLSRHVNRTSNVQFNANTRSIDNSGGSYNLTGSRCENTYCHSIGNTAATALPNYTAKWGADMITGGYKTGMRCKYCHGSKTGFAGMTAAMPNYANTSPKANRHQKHVVTYGFTCTRCHVNVTVNNSSIDASGGTNLHLNKKYNVNFNNTPIDNTLGTYTLQTATPFSKCKNTYCHSRGTDFTSPYGTRTSFANFTARWGDTVGGYKQAVGLKAKCNYCHGNRLFAGMTSAMPNYSTVKSKNNSHNRHVAGYGFTCDACHERVTTNNTSIAPSGRGLHANKGYNVDFNKDVAGRTYINNTGSYTYIDLATKSRCKNTYCHSRGADLAKPFNTRTSFSVFTAMWGDDLKGLGYKKPAGQKAKCNYCHGDKRFSGTTSAMPNYSGNVGAVKAKANSHRAHVIGQGIVCSTCHNNIVRNNTSISDRTRHVNGFYNISIEPAKRGASGLKVYSMVYNGGGGICMNNTCHGNDKPKWGDPSTTTCRGCHFATSGQEDNYGQPDQVAAKIYSTEYMSTGHGRTSRYPYSNRPNAGTKVTCTNCHKTAVAHNTPSNPFRLMTSDPDAFCKGCHGTSTERSASLWTIANVSSIDYKSHSKQGLIDGGFSAADGGWNFPTGNNGNAKCVDCHDPHGDKNRKMLHTLINYSGSNSYGQPGTYTPTGTQQRYTAYGAQIGWSSFVSAANKTEGICQRCHTPQATMENFNKSTYETAHKAHQKCTGCHDHKASFAPAESSGGQSCANCHANLFTPMNSSTRSYHHVMQNTSATGGSKYPIGNNYTTVAEARRRCLQCHVDHDIFRPELNPGNKGRAGNLRASIDITPVAGTPSTYDRSDYSRTAQDGGICMSCHKRAQRKSNKQVEDPSVFTLKLFTSLYGTSPHNYNVTSFQIKKDSSNFKANCLKCHNDTMEKTMYKNSTGFGLHDSSLRRLNAKLGLSIHEGTATTLGSLSTIYDDKGRWNNNKFNGRGLTITSGMVVQTRNVQGTYSAIPSRKRLKVKPNFTAAPGIGVTFTVGDPPEEDFCFNCHSLSDNPNSGIYKDFYGVADYVNVKALKMEQTFNGDYGKPKANGSTSTIKKAAAPTVAWFNGTTISAGKVTGWAGYSVKITGGTGINQERTIWRNTTATLFVKPNWTTTPTSTSTFAIGNPFRHRIDQFSGLHLSDEAVRSPGGLTTYGWFTSIGTRLHVACADCHNPHSQRKPGAAQGTTANGNTYNTISTIQDNGLVGGSKNWTPNQWRGMMLAVINRNQAGEERMIISNTIDKLRVNAMFNARLTGIYYNIIPRGRAEVSPSYDGNALNGPNNGQWGVKVTRWTKAKPSAIIDSVLDNMSTPIFSKVTTLRSMAYPTPNKVYELCLKCHSQYGWGTSGKPFRVMDGGIRALGTYTAGRSRDIAAAVNPNNLAHHALVAVGNNQPIRENYTGVPGFRSITSYYNIGDSYRRWPKWSPTGSSSTLRIDTTGKARVSASTGGLPSTVIPGWYVYVGGNNPPAKQQGTTGNGRKGYLQIKEITNYTSFQVNTPPGVAVNNITSFAISAGLGNAFVPPYGPWSVIGCADCHDTDGSNDPSGPHGSGRNWLLRKMEKQKFSWMNSSGFIRTIGWAVDSGWTGTYASNTLCLNCHRADVYGNEGATDQNPLSGTAPSGADFPGFKWRGKISRQIHNPAAIAGGNSEFDGALNAFRIGCMNCHAGQQTGQIHGTNLGKGSAGTSYRGKRFLTGGAWDGVTRATTAVGLACVEGPSTYTPATVNNCGGSGLSPTTEYASYDYDGGAD